MRHKHIAARLFAVILLGAFSALLLASTDDTQQPIHIEADRADIDEGRGVMTYIGHVLLRQGGIELRADTVVVYSKDGELQRITAQGQPVRYLQKKAQQQSNTETESSKTEIRGVSQRMEYDASSKQVLLLGNAEFWQGKNHFSGHRIQYDPAAKRVLANSTDDALPDNQSPSRVTVTLQPRKNTD